jgi:hypothetical protein
MTFLRATIKYLNSGGKEAESTCMRDERKSGDGIVSKINTEKRSERSHAVNPRAHAFPGRQAGIYQGAGLQYV